MAEVVYVALCVTGDRGPRLVLRVGEGGRSQEACSTDAWWQNTIKMLLPKGKLCDAPLRVSVGDIRLLGHPTSIPHVTALKDDLEQLSVLSCVFAVNGSFVSNGVAPEALLSASQRFASALRFEQVRCGYVSQQLQVIGDQRDTGDGSISCSLKSELQALCKCARTLSNEIVEVNAWLSVPVSARLPATPTDRPRPYQTLLLRVPNEVLLSQLPPDSAADLMLLIQRADPRRPFAQLQMELDIPLTRLYELSNHLVRWHVASIIDTVITHSVFSLTAAAHRAVRDLQLQATFASRYPGWTLLDALSLFSEHASLQEHRETCGKMRPVEVGRRRYDSLSRVVVWLLQRELIEHMRTFVEFVVPDGMELATAVKDYCHEGDKDLILRMSAHCDGRTHMEELIYLLQVSRDRLTSTIEANQILLKTVVY